MTQNVRQGRCNSDSVNSVIYLAGNINNSIEYAPFGETITDYATSGPAPRLGWIGKERDAETGHGNFGVRNYDFEGGRFLSGDALWEEYRAWSPYQYSSNNPGAWKDPSGESGVATIDHENNTIVIESHFVFYGSGINSTLAGQLAEMIQSKWNEPGVYNYKGTEYKISFKITYEVTTRENARTMARDNFSTEYNAKNNYIRIDAGGEQGEANMNGNIGTWAVGAITDENGDANWVAAHEYMHGFGIFKHNLYEEDAGASQNIGVTSRDVPEGVTVDPIVEQKNLRNIFHANPINGRTKLNLAPVHTDIN